MKDRYLLFQRQMYSAFRVAACDVNGARSFLKEYGGTLLPDSEEGILQGMEMYAAGEIQPLHVDYEKRNQKIIQKCEVLFQK